MKRGKGGERGWLVDWEAVDGLVGWWRCDVGTAAAAPMDRRRVGDLIVDC